jgi:alpha-D-ribose 1-methylphosphonate 5-triphosphate synthase subunit PhnH
MRRTLTVYVRRERYTILRSPDPLTDADGARCMALPDPDQHVIWIDPAVEDCEFPSLLRDVGLDLYRRSASAGASRRAG